MALPTLILAPGAWHTSASFSKIAPKLEASGFKVVTVSFPSVGDNPAVDGFKNDVEAVRDVVLAELDADKDVVIVAHSWSGAPVNSALEGLSKKERIAKGEKAGVTKLVFISAFVVPEGLSLFKAMGEQVPDLWNIDGDVVRANDPIHYFYNDLPREEAEHYATQLKPHAKATKYADTTGAAWRTIPSVYLICEDDNAIPWFVQEGMVKGCQEAGADIRSEKINSGHSPFLSKPDETVDFVVREAKS